MILLNVWLAAVPLIACATVILPKLTVPEPGAKVPPLLVQLPLTVWVKVPEVNVVPLPNTTLPPTDKSTTPVALADPFIVKLPPIAVVRVCNVFIPLPDKVRLV